MVLGYNPAGLAELRGTQLLLNANLAIMTACVDPIGYYGWGVYGGGQPSRLTDIETGQSLTLDLGSTNDGPEGAYYRGRLDTVCLDDGLTPVPEVGLTARISEALGVGFGLIFPAFTPQGRWGGENAIINTPAGLRPAATRYMLLQSGTLALFPTLGAGYRLTRWLRIGGSFEWGMINVDHTSMAAVSSGTSPSSDIVAHVRAHDLFIPAFTASLHVVPDDAIDIVAAFRYQGDLDAHGQIDLTTGLHSATHRPRTKTNEVVGVHQRFPWKLRVGFRYADRLAPRPNGTGNEEASSVRGGRIHDAFEDERWDAELDIEYQGNSRHQDLMIHYAPEQIVEFESLTGMVTGARFPDTSRSYTQIPKRWKDQVSVRAGGSYNILPGIFGVSAGVHFENRGRSWLHAARLLAAAQIRTSRRRARSYHAHRRSDCRLRAHLSRDPGRGGAGPRGPQGDLDGLQRCDVQLGRDPRHRQAHRCRCESQ